MNLIKNFLTIFPRQQVPGYTTILETVREPGIRIGTVVSVLTQDSTTCISVPERICRPGILVALCLPTSHPPPGITFLPALYILTENTPFPQVLPVLHYTLYEEAPVPLPPL